MVLCKRFSVQLDNTARSLVTPGRKRSPMRGMMGLASKRSSATGAEPRRTTLRAESFNTAELINTRRSVRRTLQQPLGHIDRQFRLQPTRYSWLLRTSRLALMVGIGWLLAMGLCKAGQSSCAYNPVTSCYGCPKFMPSLEPESHVEAIEGMRDQVRPYPKEESPDETPAYRQLTRALAGAQQALTPD